MTRKDYDEIKNKFQTYVASLSSYDTKSIEDVFDPLTRFYNSVNKVMPNGDQHSREGVYNYLNYGPKPYKLHTSIYNYACRISGDDAYGYSEVVCTAFDEKLSYIEYTIIMQTTWKKTTEWKITSLRQETVYEGGDLKEEYEKYWHFDTEKNGRTQVVRGECDSPWINVPEEQDYLTEEEKIKDCIIENMYGYELNSFWHCMETYSRNFNAYVYWPIKGQNKKVIINDKKNYRDLNRYGISPLKFRKIEIEDDRAFVYVDRVRGGDQKVTGTSGGGGGSIDINEQKKAAALDGIIYEYNKDNIDIEHSCARGNIELVKEDGKWMICFEKFYKGIYECGSWQDGSYGDLV